ncbi:MAG TPA: DUF1269 domain-containing protein [Anaerolineaceae bacterium]|nr:DUF1269 domain-containing protein [Anaerolineaceae bacterium]
MDRMLVIIFDDERKAYEGSKALQDLANEGSINLYSKAVIGRDANGKVVVRQSGDMGPVGTGVGLLTGTLIGLLGGPVGVVVGAGVGTGVGMLADLARAGISADFLGEIERNLGPGKAAVVAEVWEEWMLPVDTRMEPLGGVVFRRTRGEVIDSQFNTDVKAGKAEIAELKAERDQAVGAARDRLQAKIDAAKTRMQKMQDDIQARIESSEKEAEAKIKSLQEQADKAKGDRKAKIEKRIAEIRTEQAKRRDQLKQALEDAREALKM